MHEDSVENDRNISETDNTILSFKQGNLAE